MQWPAELKRNHINLIVQYLALESFTPVQLFHLDELLADSRFTVSYFTDTTSHLERTEQNRYSLDKTTAKHIEPTDLLHVLCSARQRTLKLATLSMLSNLKAIKIHMSETIIFTYNWTTDARNPIWWTIIKLKDQKELIFERPEEEGSSASKLSMHSSQP